MRGQPNTFRDTWITRTVATPAGTLEYIVFPGPPRFSAAHASTASPIAPADAHRILDQLGDEHASMPYIGDGQISVPPRQPM